MVTQQVKRKPTAILSADVAGYSRLMERSRAVNSQNVGC